MIYTVQDHSCGVRALWQIEASNLDEAKAIAEDWMLDVYQPEDKTYWVDVELWFADEAAVNAYLDMDIAQQIDAGQIVGVGWEIEIEPIEPDCVEDDEPHNFRSRVEEVGGIEESPGVYGHGGGVTVTEYCPKCRTYKRTDTWDQHGGVQGYTSVCYFKDSLKDEDEDF